MPLYKIFLPVKENRLRQITEASSCVRTEASYMVELSVALPFFTGFLAALLFFFQALCVQQEVGNALLAAGRELSVLACGSGGAFACKRPGAEKYKEKFGGGTVYPFRQAWDFIGSFRFFGGLY